MEYKTLVRELGEKLGLELDGALGAVGLEIEGVSVVLQLAGGARGDILFTHADLGQPPPECRDALGRAVLEANFLYQGTGGASFALNPADGHLHLQRYDWLDRLDVDAAVAMLQRFFGTISSWRTILADIQHAPVDPETVPPLGAFAIPDGFLQA